MKQKLHTDPLGPFTKHTVESIEESDSGPMPNEFGVWTLDQTRGRTYPASKAFKGPRRP